MTHTRKWILGTVAFVLPLTSVLLIGVGPVSAKKAPVDQPGTLQCTKITGSFKFVPPLLATSDSTSETVTVKSTVTDCTPSGGGATPKKGTSAQTANFSSNGCAAVLEGAAKPETVTTKWSPATIAATTIAFPPATSTTSPITFTLGGKGTGGSGSYTETDGGAGSTVTLDIAGTQAGITSTCESKKGLKSLAITGGTATIK